MAFILIPSGLVVRKTYNEASKVLNLRLLETLKKDEKTTWEISYWEGDALKISRQIQAHDNDNGIKGSIIAISGSIQKLGLREYNGKTYTDSKVTARQIIFLKNIREATPEDDLVEEEDF